MNLESIELEAELSILWQRSALITGRGIFLSFSSAEDLELAEEVSSTFGAKSGEWLFCSPCPSGHLPWFAGG